jgi:putative chitinase
MATGITLYRAKCDTFLKKSVANSDKTQSKPSKKGSYIAVAKADAALDGHLRVVLGYEAGTWFVFADDWRIVAGDSSLVELITKQQLGRIMPSATPANIEIYHRPLNEAMHEFGIVTSKRIAAFIAQLAFESDSLECTEELGHDGDRFKGRGLIPIYGVTNYRAAARQLGTALEQTPELLATDPHTAAACAAWYWRSRGLNELADIADYQTITRRLNGGMDGYPDRIVFYRRALDALQIEMGYNWFPKGYIDIDWNNPRGKVSRYFSVIEVTKNDPRRLPRSEQVMNAIFQLGKELDKVREEWGSPILVTSWYRPAEVNTAVGGSTHSQHLTGGAADIYPANGAGQKFEDFLDDHWFGGLGYGQRSGKGFTHVDMRNGYGWKATGVAKAARWDY